MESEQRDISNETDATPLHGMENEVSEIDSSIGPNKRGRDKRSRQDKRDSGIDMLNGPLPGKILRFAIPLALSSILQQLLNSADASIAGQFVSSFSLAGIGGVNPERDLVEIIELPNHPWFVGVQYHPELRSRPNRPHPLFREFVGAALKAQEK